MSGHMKKFFFSILLCIGCDKKPIVVINPNIKIQTESLTAKKSQDNRKKSLIDSGIELLFKKHPKSVKDGLHPSTTLHSHSKHSTSNELKFQPDVLLEEQHHHDKRWKPFESIKIYTDKIKGHEDHHKGIISISIKSIAYQLRSYGSYDFAIFPLQFSICFL